MLKMNKMILSLSLIVMAFVSSKAFGYDYYSYLGDPIVWKDGESDTMYIDKDCYPKGSEGGDAIVNAMHEWENVGGADFNFNYSFAENSDNMLVLGDGKSEIMCTTDEEVGADTGGLALFNSWHGEGGETMKWYVWNVTNVRITETDIYLVGIVGGYATNCNPNIGDLFAACITHELGHSLGLLHTTDYGIMGYGPDCLQNGDHECAPVADDRQGIRHLYPDSSEEETDVGVSDIDSNAVAYSDLANEDIFVGGGLWDYFTGEDALCPNDELTFSYTLFNNGTKSESIPVLYFLSGDGVGSGGFMGGIFSDTWNETLASGEAATYDKTITVPKGLEPGSLFYISVLADPYGSLHEDDETNNLISNYIEVQIKNYDECSSSSWTVAQRMANGNMNLASPNFSSVIQHDDEVCNNSTDDDGDGTIDCDDSDCDHSFYCVDFSIPNISGTVTVTQPTQTYYQDSDHDNFGNSAVTIVATTPPGGFTLISGDCDDSNSAINPTAIELCDGVDNNCNGNVDEGCTTWYADADGDGYGDAADSVIATSQPVGYVLDNTDSNDADSSVYEIPSNTDTTDSVSTDAPVDDTTDDTTTVDAPSDDVDGTGVDDTSADGTDSSSSDAGTDTSAIDNSSSTDEISDSTISDGSTDTIDNTGIDTTATDTGIANDVETTDSGNADPVVEEQKSGGGCSMNGNTHNQGNGATFSILFVLGILFGVRLLISVKKEKIMFKKLLMALCLLGSLHASRSWAENSQDFTSLLPKSSGVYEGTVKKVETRRGTDGKTPYTYITFQVQNSLKGKAKAGEQIVIRQAGGGIWDEQKQQGEGLMIPNAPELIEGDHLVIFLGRNNRDLIPFVGGEAGVLRISHDAQAGDFMTTYAGLRINANSGDSFELGPKWKDADWEKRRVDNAQANHRPIDSRQQITETIVSLHESKPMAKDSFLSALKESLNRHPSPEIQYEEKEAGAIVIKSSAPTH